MTPLPLPPDDPGARPDRTAELMARTGLSEALIERVVRAFYARVRQDARLAPVFEAAIGDWEPHLRRIAAFWSSVALMTGRYHGRPVEAHRPLPIGPAHFDRWLALWEETARALCPPEGAAHLVEAARRIARVIQEDRDRHGGDVASPVCLAGESPAGDVAAWRRGERARLLAERAALPVAARERISAALALHVDRAVRRLLGGGVAGRAVSGYWPIRGEPDLRGWMAAIHAGGARVALPVVEEPKAPLVFRLWEPGMRLVRGHWGIPVPPPEAPALRPDLLLAPLVGWDGDGFRLGYGGGYFDRTLAALEPRPLTVGVGLQGARLGSIRPQGHDIALDAIVTEAGLQAGRG
jgi:5-formyltetrahydrofolate cyclo-ligase